MYKKPNANSPVQTLAPDLQEQLWQQMHKFSADESLSWLRAELHTRADLPPEEAARFSSESSLLRWFSWYGRFRFLQRSKGATDAIQEWISTQAPELDTTQLADLGSNLFLAIATQGGDAKAFAAVMKQISAWTNAKANQARTDALLAKLKTVEPTTPGENQESRIERLNALFGR